MGSRLREQVPRNSIIGRMNQFIQAVDEMDSTVLLPSKLRDMSFHGDSGEKKSDSLVPSETSRNGNLHDYYSMLKSVKVDLEKGLGNLSSEFEETSRRLPVPAEEWSGSEISSDDGSERESVDERDEAQMSAFLFKHHLGGLFNVLNHLTDMTNQLKSQYQRENESCNQGYTNSSNFHT